MLQYLLQLSKNVVSNGINKKTLILIKCPLYNFVPRGVSIFENARATVGNQIANFKGLSASFLKRKTRVCNIVL